MFSPDRASDDAAIITGKSFAGAIEPLKESSGDGKGGPDAEKAKKTMADANNYLSPLVGANNILKNHCDNKDVQVMLEEQRTTTDAAVRTRLIEDIQRAVAQSVPTLPLLQGAQVAVSGKGVEGVKDTLDAAHMWRGKGFRPFAVDQQRWLHQLQGPLGDGRCWLRGNGRRWCAAWTAVLSPLRTT